MSTKNTRQSYRYRYDSYVNSNETTILGENFILRISEVVCISIGPNRGQSYQKENDVSLTENGKPLIDSIFYSKQFVKHMLKPIAATSGIAIRSCQH